jgi:hypothetical protein
MERINQFKTQLISSFPEPTSLEIGEVVSFIFFFFKEKLHKPCVRYPLFLMARAFLFIQIWIHALKFHLSLPEFFKS